MACKTEFSNLLTILPKEIVREILIKSDVKTVCGVAGVGSEYHRLISETNFWELKLKSDYPSSPLPEDKTQNLYYYQWQYKLPQKLQLFDDMLIGLSQYEMDDGQLKEINLAIIQIGPQILTGTKQLESDLTDNGDYEYSDILFTEIKSCLEKEITLTGYQLFIKEKPWLKAISVRPIETRRVRPIDRMNHIQVMWEDLSPEEKNEWEVKAKKY